ncbi:hypothetical protein F8E02_05245 [Methanoculleus sp. Wushi-C6]|uniref:Uncharacterized protein n=1 Tax=Methanoculleus caldifontis TaxID=2651577 RepID=A0ABU3X049_9EURY|nr:hypothetical protein [Methanoculleus sp. Wushi-C6]MDV2481420.1 hypothetical protein [Methanoculleus sp. Wushi-C6]
MNCATTHSAGPCRGPGDTPSRRSAHRKASLREPFPEETDQVWIEAGFLPPADCRSAVALLHRLAMEEEPAASLLSPALVAAAMRSDEAGCGYRILDSKRLRRTAREYGIDPAGRDDAGIARAVTLAVIADYGETAPEERA